MYAKERAYAGWIKIRQYDYTAKRGWVRETTWLSDDASAAGWTVDDVTASTWNTTDVTSSVWNT